MTIVLLTTNDIYFHIQSNISISYKANNNIIIQGYYIIYCICPNTTTFSVFICVCH